MNTPGLSFPRYPASVYYSQAYFAKIVCLTNPMLNNGVIDCDSFQTDMEDDIDLHTQVKTAEDLDIRTTSQI